jgi:cytochrome c oxidase subunit 3
MTAIDPDPAEPGTHARVAEIQFADLARQADAVRFGIWVFLASELLLFAGLFALYTAYRTEYPAGFAAGVAHAELAIGTVNTSLLAISSYTAASALRTIRRDERRAALGWLGATLALGVAFLALKGIEYGRHAADGALPGAYYAFADLPGHGGQLFFTLYYFMTGLHVLHLVAAIAILAWLTARVSGGRTTAAYHADLEAGVLYWHLVDCIWMTLYVLFYLMT